MTVLWRCHICGAFEVERSDTLAWKCQHGMKSGHRNCDELEREVEKLMVEKKEWEWALTALQGVKEATREWANSSDPNRDVVLLRRLGPEFDAFDERGEPHPVERLKP